MATITIVLGCNVVIFPEQVSWHLIEGTIKVSGLSRTNLTVKSYSDVDYCQIKS